MKLFIYNRENSLSGSARNGERTIRLSRNTGVIYMSRTLADKLELAESDKLLFANDEENKKDWYISKTTDPAGFNIKNDKSGVRLSNKFLSTKILDSLKIALNATFLVASEPMEIDSVKYYKIIASSPITSNVKRVSPKKK